MVEVMFTSASPFQFIAGKALGLMAVAFTQIAIWLLALVVAMLVVALEGAVLPGIRIEPAFLLLVVLYFVPTYALVAGMMITLGSMVTELQQGQQIAGIVNLLFLAPFFAFVLVFTNPDSPLMVAMTLFPTTAFMTVAHALGGDDRPCLAIGRRVDAAGWRGGCHGGGRSAGVPHRDAALRPAAEPTCRGEYRADTGSAARHHRATIRKGLMRNVWLVAKHEILTTIGKKSFWFMTLLFPADDHGLQPLSVPFCAGHGGTGAVPRQAPRACRRQAMWIRRAIIVKLPAGLPPDRLRVFAIEAAAKRRWRPARSAVTT